MSIITSSISSIIDSELFKKSRQPLMYCSMVALTTGVQEIFQQVVFNCPCKRHFEYGLAFLCGPAILLFFLGIFLDDTLCRTGPERDTEKAMTSPVCHYFKLLFTIFYAMTLASVAPVAWLVLSFLQQKYHTCAYFGPPVERISAATNATEICSQKWRGIQISIPIWKALEIKFAINTMSI